MARQVRDISLELYHFAEAYAGERGIIIADTKFEFGLTDDGLILIDELFTPDSSRFWPARSYQPGSSTAQFRQTVCPRLPGERSLEQASARSASTCAHRVQNGGKI